MFTRFCFTATVSSLYRWEILGTSRVEVVCLRFHSYWEVSWDLNCPWNRHVLLTVFFSFLHLPEKKVGKEEENPEIQEWKNSHVFLTLEIIIADIWALYFYCLSLLSLLPSSHESIFTQLRSNLKDRKVTWTPFCVKRIAVYHYIKQI